MSQRTFFVRRIAEGRQAEVFPYGDGRVVKLFRRNWPEAARWECSIAKMAYAQGARTPQAFEVIEQDGRPGIVFERVEGNSLLAELGKRPWRVQGLARQFAELHHTVHRCNAPELYAARPLLEQIIQSREELSHVVKAALLKQLAVLPDGDSLLHWDFHPDNVMVTSQGLRVIDWPNAARGCPMADVARTMIIFRVGEALNAPLYMRLLVRILKTLFRRAYLSAYFTRSPYSLADLAQWEPILAAQRLTDGIPGEAEKLVSFIQSRLAV